MRPNGFVILTCELECGDCFFTAYGDFFVAIGKGQVPQHDYFGTYYMAFEMNDGVVALRIHTILDELVLWVGNLANLKLEWN